MDRVNKVYDTVQVRFEEDICFLRIHRPEAGNTINSRLVEECLQVLELCIDTVKIIVLEGLAEVFCLGADFQCMRNEFAIKKQKGADPEALYNFWFQLASGPFITIAHVRGKVNAGGIGFVAACDIVLSDDKAIFSLSELLFGLMPACVLPFLTRRIGFSKANYMTLMTHPVTVAQAKRWGLVDAYEQDSRNLLRKHLLRLKKLTKTAVIRYKRYINSLEDYLTMCRSKALEANREVFSDPWNLEMIARYVNTGKLPWEKK